MNRIFSILSNALAAGMRVLRHLVTSTLMIIQRQGTKVLQFLLLVLRLLIRMFLYLVLTALSLFGNTPLRRKLEELLGKIQDPRTSFSEMFVWLILSLFMAFRGITASESYLKIVFGIFGYLFILAFLLKTRRIQPHYTFEKTLVRVFRPTFNALDNILIAIIIPTAFIFFASWWLQDTKILHFIPLLAILTYFIYVRSKFLPQQTEENTANDIYQARHFVNQLYFPTIMLLGLILMLFIGLFTLKVIDDNVLSGIYSISQRLYPVLLSIMAGFAVFFLRQDQNNKVTHLRKPWLGLAQMCIVFILITIIGLLLGTQLKLDNFLKIVSFNEIWTNMDSVMTLLRTLFLEFILLSFPVTLLYTYAMLKTVLHSNPE